MERKQLKQGFAFSFGGRLADQEHPEATKAKHTDPEKDPQLHDRPIWHSVALNEFAHDDW